MARAAKPAAKKVATPRKDTWERFKANPSSIDQLCEFVAGGDSLNAFVKGRKLAYVTVLEWIEADRARSEKYARAKELRADATFESLDDVSNQATRAKSAVKVAGLRLKADNIKWKLARMAPKKYGDRTTLAGDSEAPLSILMEQIAASPRNRITFNKP